jgi:O-antigen/teichoic acid export membrane protein
MKDKLLALHQDTLFRNSLYLMLSTGVMAALGFVFWLINARLFSPSQIGVATTLISAMTLISYISLLGFNSTFIRFLPTSKNRNSEINTGLLLCLGAAIVVSTAYVLIVPHVAPRLSLLTQHWAYALGFIAMAALAALNLLTDSIFIAFRAAKYNFLVDGILMSSIKLGLPFAFVSLGAYGVFTASGAAAAAATGMSILFLILRFNYRPQLRVERATLRHVFHYSFSNYIANLLNIAPTLVLPLVIINRLGSASAGYYYLAFMVANLLYTVAYAVAQSLFAEGSYAERGLRELLKKSSLILAAIVVPSTLVLYFGAHLLLTLYGRAYGQNAVRIMQVLALAAPAVTVYTMSGVLLRITKQTYSLIVTNVIYFGSIAGLALLWAPKGLVWIGYAWLVGQIVSGGAGFILLVWHRRAVARRLA